MTFGQQKKNFEHDSGTCNEVPSFSKKANKQKSSSLMQEAGL
jgi:hypothetical protein